MKLGNSFKIKKTDTRSKHYYDVSYKGVDYVYTYEYYHGTFGDAHLFREDGKDINKGTYNKIMNIINNINNWEEVEE